MNAQSISNCIADPATYADPTAYHDLFADLRDNDPVRWTDPEGYRPFWTVSRHADIIQIEKRHDVFLNAPRTALRSREQEEQIRKVTGSTQAARTLIQMDEPDHRLYRKLTQNWFLPARLRKLEGDLSALAHTYIDRMEAAGGRCDFTRDVAVWFPLRVMMMILGVPEDDGALMLRLTQQHFAGSDPSVRGDKPQDAGAAAREIFSYFTELTAQRRRDPQDDIVSLLADAQVNGEPISDFDRNSYFFVLAIAGHDTTSSSISGTLHALLQHPEEMRRLRADRSLLASAINEGIRWTSPVRHFFRTATEDYEIGGQTIRAGDSVMLCYPSANVDERAFDDPRSFRIDRSPNPQIAFGFGVHSCIGLHLAKMEMKALFDALLDRVDHIEQTGDARWIESNFVGGVASLPISYHLRTTQPA